MLPAAGKPAPIFLPSSNSEQALVAAIRQAASSGRTLLLEPGPHFTAPGQLQTIAIGAEGLQIGSGLPAPASSAQDASAAKAFIKRPDFSIPASAPDDNFGLFFLPAGPTPDELATAVWKPGQDASGQFNFDVFVRGSITISDLSIDANMGKQNLESLPADAAAHSAMLGFSGQVYPVTPGPDNVPRRAYVAFQSVTLRNLRIFNGGFADDILFTYFRAFAYPNIQQVMIENIVSGERVSPARGTITFSGLAANVDIRNVDIIELHAESDADWKTAPRNDPAFTPSQWALDTINAHIIVLSVAGRVIRLNGRRMVASTACQIALLGGTISNSTFAVVPGPLHKNHRFFRLDGLTFDHVTWHFPADSAGVVAGLFLGTLLNETSVARFLNNKFGIAAGNTATAGQLIDSAYSTNTPGDTVDFTFRGCQYEAAFGSPAFPNTKIARVNERGTWRFAREDFLHIDPHQAIEKGPQNDVILIIAPSKTG